MHLQRQTAQRAVAFDFEPRVIALARVVDVELGQQRPELILRTAQHRRTRDDVFGDRVLHEQVRRDDRNLAACEHRLVKHAARSAPMVRVGVGEDDSRDGPPAAMLETNVPCP